jgi:hypothetical protein
MRKPVISSLRHWLKHPLEAPTMPERTLANEMNRINGALEVLGLMRERLVLQRDEMGAETGREAVDEMLSQVESLQTEYSRRRANLQPHHRSYQFLITDEGVLPLPHDDYVDLVRGKSILREFAGRTLRLADWYVRMEDDVPQLVVNETYSWLVFDDCGRMDLHAARAIEASPLPTQDERDGIEERLFAVQIRP